MACLWLRHDMTQTPPSSSITAVARPIHHRRGAGSSRLGCDWAPFGSRRVAFTPAEQRNSQTVHAHRNTAARKSIETGVSTLADAQENVPRAPSDGEQSGEQWRAVASSGVDLLLRRSNAPTSAQRKRWVRLVSQTAGILWESYGNPVVFRPGQHVTGQGQTSRKNHLIPNPWILLCIN